MAGKGDKPRNCHSSKFKANFAEIKWKANDSKAKRVETKKNKTRYYY